MSKKRKRNIARKKRKKPHAINANCTDRHHLCYQRHNWRNGDVKKLRLHPYCIAEIPKYTLHGLIHGRVPDIPAPTEIAARCALEQLEILEQHGAIHETDPLYKRLWVLFALFDCICPETAAGFKKQLDVVREFYCKPP